MKRYFILGSLMVFSVAGIAPGASADDFTIKINGIDDGKPIPTVFAYCMPDGNGKTKSGGNISPDISWSGTPAGTKSYALIVVDRDVPATFELANQENKTIPIDFSRQDFYHWVLIDIPVGVTHLVEGADSKGTVAGGKPTGQKPYGISGQNDYSKVSAGPNGGYDGPCPPWNDERLHHYHFIVYALDVPTLGLSGNFKGKDALDAMQNHILAKAEIVGTFTNHQR